MTQEIESCAGFQKHGLRACSDFTFHDQMANADNKTYKAINEKLNAFAPNLRGYFLFICCFICMHGALLADVTMH